MVSYKAFKPSEKIQGADKFLARQKEYNETYFEYLVKNSQQFCAAAHFTDGATAVHLIKVINPSEVLFITSATIGLDFSGANATTAGANIRTGAKNYDTIAEIEIDNVDNAAVPVWIVKTFDIPFRIYGEDTLNFTIGTSEPVTGYYNIQGFIVPRSIL